MINVMGNSNMFLIQKILTCQRISFSSNKNGDRYSTNILATTLEQKPSDYVPLLVIPFIYPFHDSKMRMNFIENTFVMKLYGSIFP